MLADATQAIQSASAGASPPLADSIRRIGQQLQKLKGSITLDSLDQLAIEVVQAAGAFGWRRYAAGQKLMVRRGPGEWVDAEVQCAAAPGDTAHQLRPEAGGGEQTLSLHPWNHAPLELPSAVFAEELQQWKVSLRPIHDIHTYVILKL